MKILVCGNINSGKSFLIEKLKNILPDYKVFKIDNYRIKYGDGTLGGEKLAKEQFIKNCSMAKDGFIELTGFGELAKNLRNQLESKQYIILYLNTNVEKCLERIKFKDFSKIPYPTYTENIEDTVIRLNKEYINFEKEWEECLEIIKVNNIQEIKNIPFNHYEKLTEIINTLYKNKLIDEIVSFGTLANGKLNNLSDIDLIVVTQLDIKLICIYLQNNITLDFIDELNNKITLRIVDLLIEIVVVKKIEEHLWFYSNSIIENEKRTIIKGNEDTLNKLTEYNSNFKSNYGIDEKAITKRLIYYVLSLKNLINKDDDYKYFFHSNIVLHELIKLQNIIIGNTKYNYLPKNICLKNEFFDVKDLIYDFNKEKSHHLNFLFDTTINILEKLNYKKEHLDYIKQKREEIKCTK